MSKYLEINLVLQSFHIHISMSKTSLTLVNLELRIFHSITNEFITMLIFVLEKISGQKHFPEIPDLLEHMIC